MADLYIQTHAEMTNCDIQFKPPKSKQKGDSTKKERKAPTLAEVRQVKTEHRAHFPEGFENPTKIENEIKNMLENGKTKADIEEKFRADYNYAGCYLCRIKPYKPHYHKAYGPYGCPILKLHFDSYNHSSNNQNSSAIGHARNAKPVKPGVRKKQVPSTIPSSTMCYDTGTTPKSLCSKKEYFRELVLYDTPKFVTLADQDSFAQVLGQGMLDIIVNNKYRFWIFAYFTAKSDTLLSAVDHLSYTGCAIHGTHGTIKVTFPTFSFDILGSQNFEFQKRRI